MLQGVYMDYIGISEDRLHHILGVARKAYSLAKDMGYDEDFARRMFMLGWNHDIGYEFSTEPTEHLDVSAKMYLETLDDIVVNDTKSITYQAIKYHGRYTENETTEWKILNMADMQVDFDGKEVDVITRLNNIRERYGEHSNEYLTACDICFLIGLTPVNFGGNIT